jgi:hypothetical protein
MLRKSRIGEPYGLRAVHCFSDGPLKESILDVELMDWPVLGVSKSEDCANCSKFDNRTESFVIVDAGLLSEAAEDPTCPVAVQRAISMEFMFKNPFAGDYISLGGARNKIPSMICHEGSKFFFHGMSTKRISKSVAACPGNQR